MGAVAMRRPGRARSRTTGPRRSSRSWSSGSRPTADGPIMSRLIMWNLMTVDGCFEGAKSWDLAFHQAVWGPELEAFSIEQLRTADRLLFGRVTYEGMAAYWRTAQGEVADFMNRLPKVVFSTSLTRMD